MDFSLKSTEFYKKYMLKIIRDGIKKQRVHLKESSQELAKIGYSITEDSMLEIAKKVIQGHVSLDGKYLSTDIIKIIMKDTDYSDHF